MPDLTNDAEGGFHYFCARCGRELGTRDRCIKIEVLNIYGNIHDYILACSVCAKQLFPATKVL